MPAAVLCGLFDIILCIYCCKWRECQLLHCVAYLILFCVYITDNGGYASGCKDAHAQYWKVQLNEFYYTPLIFCHLLH